MMINIAGNPFRSIIGFKDAAGRTHAFLVKEFAEQSEHITLSTGVDADGQPEGSYVNHTESFGGTFTGI